LYENCAARAGRWTTAIEVSSADAPAVKRLREIGREVIDDSFLGSVRISRA
jgi:hypothetical protein